MPIGGSVEEVNIDGRPFEVASDADANRDLGGFSGEVQSNGNGGARFIKTRKPWMIDGISLSCDDDLGDQEFLQETVDAGGFVTFSVTLANGETYAGQGNIVDDLKMSTQSVTVPLSFSGPLKLEKQ
jgi:hypothetical protein